MFSRHFPPFSCLKPISDALYKKPVNRALVFLLIFFSLSLQNAYSQDRNSLEQAILQSSEQIAQQQELVLQHQNQLQQAQQALNKDKKSIIDKRMQLKQLKLQAKRLQMDDSNKAELRKVNYKQKVTDIEINKLNKRQANKQQQINKLKQQIEQDSKTLLALSEQRAEQEMALAKLAKSQKPKLKKKTPPPKRRATAKAKTLNPKEQKLLAQQQTALRKQAQNSSSLADTMLYNTKAVALIPITGKPNLGQSPQLKRLHNNQFASLGKLKHLGNSQYSIEVYLKAGENHFKVEEFSYKKSIKTKYAGRKALLLLDARNVKAPEFTLVRK